MPRHGSVCHQCGPVSRPVGAVGSVVPFARVHCPGGERGQSLNQALSLLGAPGPVPELRTPWIVPGPGPLPCTLQRA